MIQFYIFKERTNKSFKFRNLHMFFYSMLLTPLLLVNRDFRENQHCAGLGASWINRHFEDSLYYLKRINTLLYRCLGNCQVLFSACQMAQGILQKIKNRDKLC